jgi:acetyl-CoA carboxylase carboxyl transferase subunit beta
MPISEWFKAREERRYTPVSPPPEASDLPDGVWVKCDACKRTIYQGDLDASFEVCPQCGKHGDLTAVQRIAMLVDDGSFAEIDSTVSSTDPLSFTSGKAYADVLASAVEETGLSEAIVTGCATIDGHAVVAGAMDFRFVGASMGSAVGEKLARAFELAASERRPLVLATASGGARMQESMLSLMQMAKTAAAAAVLAEARVPYIAILTNPTMGGVTASFASLADVILAEPGALVGFAGPRLIEQATRQTLPKGFQTSEFLLKHGMVDEVVDRRELAERVALFLKYLGPGGE